VLYVSNKFGILRVGTCNNKLFIEWERSLLHVFTHKYRLRTNLQINSRQQEVVAYFAKAMKYYRDKESLVIPFNTGNHCVTLAISTKYDQAWYCDSSRPTDSITDDRLTHDWTDVIVILNK
jgi:hypothetical protein